MMPKTPVIMKIDNSGVIDNLINIDVKKQITGERNMEYAENNPGLEFAKFNALTM